MSTDGQSRSVSLSMLFLGLLAVWSALWPTYRAFLNVEIDINEGWNAYYADAALGRMPLYPSRDQLITNNYPPLSFYLVGALGRLIGDTVLAGRLLSLAAVTALAVLVARSIKRLGGSTTAACVGALYFLATMCRFFTDYVGMNDPQLFAQAIMTLGFLVFLRADARQRGYAAAFVLMVIAGFMKHNIIVMPLTCLLWLGWHRPRQAVKCGLLSAALIAAGFALCYAAYGSDFFANLMAPRVSNWKHALGAVGRLQWLAVGLLAAIILAVKRWGDPSVRLCSLFIALALVSYFLQKTGDGVAENAQFELLVGVSLAVGLAFAHLSSLAVARRPAPEVLRLVLLIAICLRLVVSTRLEAVRVLTDPNFHRNIAVREAAMADTVSRIRATPGDVICNPLACYRAGKPFIVDAFNCSQRIKTGKLPPDAIDKLVAAGKATIVDADPLLSWSAAPRPAPGPAPQHSGL